MSILGYRNRIIQGITFWDQCETSGTKKSMLFNSFVFFFGFLPIVFACYFVAASYKHELAILILGLASLCFYSYWDLRVVPLLLSSILINYFLGNLIAKARFSDRRRARILLVFGLSLNLGCIAFFKYLNWF